MLLAFLFDETNFFFARKNERIKLLNFIFPTGAEELSGTCSSETAGRSSSF